MSLFLRCTPGEGRITNRGFKCGMRSWRIHFRWQGTAAGSEGVLPPLPDYKLCHSRICGKYWRTSVCKQGAELHQHGTA